MIQVEDDEIDLIEFFQILWEGKWVLSAFIVISTLIGFGYSQVAQPKYDVSAPYSVNIYSVSAQQICNINVGCMEDEAIKRLVLLLEDWNKAKKSSSLSLSTITPLDISEYKAQIERANVTLTNDVYEEATNELTLIQSELPDALLSTERVASNMLNAKRIIQSIDNGQSAINYGSIAIIKSSLKVSLILALSVVLGGTIGVFFVLYRKAIMKRKEQLSKE
jgi:hypothetical protein